MSAVFNLVFFVILCRKVLSHPTTAGDNSSRTFQSIPETLENVVEMGKEIEEIPLGSPTIKTLNLAYNHISELEDITFHNKSYKALTSIELNQNRITIIHLTAFRGLKHLSSVDLSDNNITSLDPYTFKYNPKLKKVNLSGNNIAMNRLQVFMMSQTVEKLVLSQNGIDQIFEISFMGLPSLRTLILDSNELFMIAPNSFKTLSKLQYLSLANTGVYRLSESMFDTNLPRIIDLSETPLSKRFDPPLNKVVNNAVKSLVQMDRYFAK